MSRCEFIPPAEKGDDERITDYVVEEVFVWLVVWRTRIFISLSISLPPISLFPANCDDS